MHKTPEHLKKFEKGQLCYVVYRRHKGMGPYKLLLHDAKLTPKTGYSKPGFVYGYRECLVVDPPKPKPSKIGFKPQSIKS